MRKIICTLLACALLLTGGIAMAAGTTVNLNGSALVRDNDIIYAGSIDGVEAGVYWMNLDGTVKAKLCDGDKILLAASDKSVMVYDWTSSTADIVSFDGKKLATISNLGYDAIEAGGKYYTGPSAVNVDGTGLTSFITVDAGLEWTISPISVDGGYLYFYDNRAYGELAAEDTWYTASLCRIPLAGGDVQVISDVGTEYLGMDANSIYYARTNFDYLPANSDTVSVKEVNEGVFSANKDGSNERLLAPSETGGDNSYISGFHLVDGVIYTEWHDYAGDATTTTIKRMKVDGTALPDIALSMDAQFIGMQGDNLYVAAMEFDESATREIDKVYAVSLADQSQKLLNPNTDLALFYSEGPATAGIQGNAIYATVNNQDTLNIELISIQLDGSGIKTLAKGYTWSDGSDATAG